MFRPFAHFHKYVWLFAVAAAAVATDATLSGCQSKRYKEFETIHGGMSKGDVLAVMGNPDRTQRWHGRDRWQYTLYGHPDGDVVREVHFENGRSTYVGAAIKPAISADEQDRLNEIGNREAEIRENQALSNESNGIQIQRFEPVDRDTGGVSP